MQLYYAPITQRCPSCQALPGEHCRPTKRSTQWATTRFHTARKALVDGLSDAEKQQALQQMQAARRQRQRGAGATVIPFPDRAKEEC